MTALGTPTSRSPTLLARLRSVGPGLLLAIVIALAAHGAEMVEAQLLGDRYFESLVLAILIGTAVRSAGRLPHVFDDGIRFAAHFVLEVAIVLLGATISLQALQNAGVGLIGGIVVIVVVAIALSYTLGRLFGLHSKLALLVACGNSICGNSAIAAAAPVIDADANDVAAAIAFTAVLGLIVVLALPLLHHLVGLDAVPFGVVSGLTVYAVPQVLAATQAGGALAVQIGTLVKLIRVMMLGPVILALGLFGPQRGRSKSGDRIKWHHMMPWFIIGFGVMMGLRFSGLISDSVAVDFGHGSNILTVVAMAALGLGVDVRDLAHSGGRVILTASLSIVILGLLAFALVGLLGLN